MWELGISDEMHGMLWSELVLSEGGSTCTFRSGAHQTIQCVACTHGSYDVHAGVGICFFLQLSCLVPRLCVCDGLFGCQVHRDCDKLQTLFCWSQLLESSASMCNNKWIFLMQLCLDLE